MTKAEKRVAVAKDVLAQIKSEKLTAHSGEYLWADLKTTAGVEGADFQSLIRNGAVKKCRACALGSAFMSYAKLYDGAKVGEFALHGTWDGKSIFSHRPTVVLRRIFTDGQMDLIESAFECGNSGDQKKSQGAIRFGLRYPSASGRLVAIMRNIVRNKGTFKPGAR